MKPFAWNIRRYTRNDLVHQETVYVEPLPAILDNLRRHYRVEVVELFDRAASDDLLDIVRTVVCMADKFESMTTAEREVCPSPLSWFSPLVIAARQACVDRGFTEGGIDLCQAASTANFIAAQVDQSGAA